VRNKPKRAQQTLRIIGGEHRGRTYPFVSADGLRPTTDRVKETLFNWLQLWTSGARVLDLYAGSGSLSWEAWSREALEVVAIERNPSAVRELKSVKQHLKANSVRLIEGDCQSILLSQNSDKPYDIVFIDPPFADEHWVNVLDLLESRGCLAKNAWVYIEQPIKTPVPPVPENWRLHREKKAGQVMARLYQRDNNED